MRTAPRFRLFLLACLLMLPCQGKAEGNSLEQALDEAFAEGQLAGLHGVLVLHRGNVLAERYYAGEDERWGQPLGEVEHGAETLHDLRSVTKSIVGLLYGIALSEALVPGLDEPVIAQFPDYADLAADPERRRILISHVLSMKMGTEWNEELPYSDPRNSEIAMEMAADRYRYVLDRPMVDQPGDYWTYNGGATAVIGRLIAEGAQVPVDTYARKKLFAPLGIENIEWVRGSDGVPLAASGLRMTIRDLARIGQLVLNKGSRQGRQVVPADWLEQSFAPKANLRDGLRYGFFWWLAGEGSPPHWVAGFGNGGQRLMISPANQLIVAVLAGNYNRPDAWQLPVRIITEFALPAIR